MVSCTEEGPGRAVGRVLTAGLHILNDGSHTFVRRGAVRSAIDLSLVSDDCHYSWRRSPDTEGSDHYPIYLEPLHAGARHTRVYDVVKWPQFRELCASVPVAGDFFGHIAACASAATVVCRVPAGTPAPDMKLLNLRAARRLVQRKAERSEKAEDWTVYNRIDAVCRRHAHHRRDGSWSSLCRTLDDRRYQKRSWRILQALLRPRIPRSPALSIAVTLGISTSQLAELLADTFCVSAAAPAGVTAPALPPHSRPELFAPLRYFPTPAIVAEIAELCSADFTMRELRSVLDSRKRRSAPGSDGITYQMLRNIDSSLLPQLLAAYNTVWRTGELPASWREALVIPLHKKGKPSSDPKSYRPVSLTSAAGKVFEAMALRRLQWIAAALDFLAAEQSGFRSHRATADCIADAVGLLEEAKHRGEAGYLVLLDVKSAFDSLPHSTITDALCAMGVSDNLLRYVQAFLSDRTFRVRIGGEISAPRSVNAGVPQGSVLSPFLFNLALARITDYLPRATAVEVRVAMYADDIALFACGPTSRGREVRASVQSYINAVDYFVSGIGLELSAEKTEALLVHPDPLARYQVAKLSLRGCQLPWQRRVRYLGLTIDHRLSWNPAIAEIRKGSRNIARVASCVLAGGKGCSPVLALRLYNAVATARTLYSVQLVGLKPIQWESLDVVHRGAVRRIFALPRTSPVGPTLAETNQLPLSLRAKAGALRHVHRMHQTQQGQQLAIRLLSRPNSGMGRHALEYAALVPEMPHCGWLPIPPHRDRGLEISTTVPGVRCKRRTPQCALQQETAAVIDGQLSGRVLLYTDGSVTTEGSAAAACIAPTLEVAGKCRLPIAASSTTAELAALDLAAEILAKFLPPAAAVLCDSRAALLALARGERGALIAQRLYRKFTVIQNSGCDLVFQWVPSHVGIQGNEATDALAKEGHDPRTPFTTFVRVSDEARLIIARHVRSLHPDARVASGTPPRVLPRTGLNRRARAFLLRLRIGCSRTADRLFRLSGSGNPKCEQCPADETIDHILLQCPGYDDHRRRLFGAFSRLGLPHLCLDELLFPSAQHSKVLQAFHALLDFFGDADLFTRL
ncbi:uncharacterized protein LOC119391795 [Rhipicephalus sanguineus]|uniref:uncharacterized protein LOC119391795 n=1 Tax=Rhipicephalus sanguineus TaxID=34632 RepID=UPI001895B0B0|nr:uncharacterized protein LOC119391795 [Rhipicephalus sanguineus]